MAKRTRVRDYDQFIVRLPPGMRDRIKEKADRAGMSMNEAIVFVLETHFPARATLEQRIGELAEKVAALKHGNDVSEAVDDLIEDIAKTLRDVSTGRVAASDSFSRQVSERLHEWDEAAMQNAMDPFDDANYGSGYQAWGPDADPDDDPFGGGKKGS